MIRVLSASALIALLAVTVWLLPPIAVFVLALVTAALGGAELAGLARAAGVPVPAPLLAGLSLLVCFVSVDRTGEPGLAPMAALLAAAVLVVATRGAPDRATIARAATVIGGPIYVGLPLAFILAIYGDDGPHGVSALALMVIASDSAQYFTGRALGRRKLASLISPAKTIEGALGGLAASAAAGAWLINWARPGASEATLVKGAVVGVAVAVAGMLGDLFESALKRGAGVKDSSTLIPGHGGVLDRIDSWLFAGPVYYLFLRYLL